MPHWLAGKIFTVRRCQGRGKRVCFDKFRLHQIISTTSILCRLESTEISLRTGPTAAPNPTLGELDDLSDHLVEWRALR